jgi:hypothetical protein
VVTPLERRATPQSARKAASRRVSPARTAERLGCAPFGDHCSWPSAGRVGTMKGTVGVPFGDHCSWPSAGRAGPACVVRPGSRERSFARRRGASGCVPRAANRDAAADSRTGPAGDRVAAALANAHRPFDVARAARRELRKGLAVYPSGTIVLGPQPGRLEPVRQKRGSRWILR